MTKQIPLTRGKFALVDDSDFEKVSTLKWHAGCYSGSYYAYHSVYRKGRTPSLLAMHRFLMNPPAGMVVDHINGDALDNRRSNLRVCRALDNARNRRKSRNNRSGYTGVSWCTRNQKWAVHLSVNGVRKTIGYKSTAIEAAKLYNAAVIKYKGTGFCKLNPV